MKRKWKKKPDIYDGDEKFRFALGVSGEKMLIVIALNPSTANEEEPDKTMQSIEKICENNNYDGFLMLNLCALRATKPLELPSNVDQKIFKDNIDKISKYLQEYQQAHILLAYGNNIEKREYFFQTLKKISIQLLSRKLYCIIFNDSGHPRHPLIPLTKGPLHEIDNKKFEDLIKNHQI